MKNAYVTKRIAPQGYVAITRPLAFLLWKEGYSITICGNNVNSYHVFKGWCLGMTIDKEKDKDYSFLEIVHNYVSYSSAELLRYPVFYVRQEVVNNMDLGILKEKA